MSENLLATLVGLAFIVTVGLALLGVLTMIFGD